MNARSSSPKREIVYAVLVRVYMVATAAACCYLPLLFLSKLTTIGAIAGAAGVVAGMILLCRRPTEKLPVLINIADIVLLVLWMVYLVVCGIQGISDAPTFGLISVIAALLHGIAAAWLFEDMRRMHWVIASWVMVFHLVVLPLFTMILLAAAQGCHVH